MNNNYIPFFAHGADGKVLNDSYGRPKMAGAYWPSTQTYLQFINTNHVHHQESAKLIDVAIYRGLLAVSPPCKYWRCELRENHAVKVVWQMPFSKLTNLIKSGFIKERQFKGFAPQYVIPLDEFTDKDHPVQSAMEMI